MSSPNRCFMNSMDRCCATPGPGELYASGVAEALAYLMRSGTERIGSAGFTTRMKGDFRYQETGAKSFSGS